MNRHQIVSWVWAGLCKPIVPVAVFVALLMMLFLSWLIPQSPVPLSDHIAFSRWLAETHGTLESAANFWASVGLFNLRSSVCMRALIVLLVFIVTVRVTTLVERWVRLTTVQRWVQGLIIIGATAIMVGWGLQTLFSWSEINLIAWSREVTVPNRGLSLVTPDGPIACFVDNTYGLFLIAQGEYKRGVRVRAEDEVGQPLPLHTSSHSAPNESLSIALTQKRPDVYFALPAAELGFRVSLQPEDERAYVQVYRFSSGALITDTLFQEAVDVVVADVHVYLERVPYTRFNLVYNPGAPLIGLGLLLFGGGNLAILALGEGFAIEDEEMQVAHREVDNDVEEEQT